MNMHRAAVCSLPIAALAGGAGANLVPNPSFETHSSCPTALAQIALAAPWSQPTKGTPDYFNVCGSGMATVPTNHFGVETPLSGDAYAGALVGTSLGMTYREYIEAPLTTPLVKGQTYSVSFNVSLADRCFFATDSIGAYLSVGSVGYVPGDAELPYTPQVINPPGNFLSGKTGWTLVQGTFTAAGGEDHIVIGNFKDNPGSGWQQLSSGDFGAAYMYYDDVSVEAVPAPGTLAGLAIGAAFVRRRPGRA